MFSYSCTVWVPLPHVLLGPYNFQNRSQSFFSLSLPSNILLIPVTLIIRSRSFLLLVRQYHFSPPHPPHVRAITTHSLQLRVGSLATFLFIIGRHNSLCIFLAILFFQFYCTTVLFIPTHPQALRCLWQPKFTL